MQNIRSKISKIKSIIERKISGPDLTAAINILADLESCVSHGLKQESPPPRLNRSELDPKHETSDTAYLHLLNELHKTQEELLTFKMQNESLLHVLHECNSTIERSNSMTIRLLSAVTQKN